MSLFSMRGLQIALVAGIFLNIIPYELEGQTIDRTLAPNPLNEGIAKSVEDQIGAGRGDIHTPGSSAYIIARDPFRAVRRGRQLFQRKFYRQDGTGAYLRNGTGDIVKAAEIGAGLTDSCAACHSRPRGSAGFGGAVATRPDSRDAPHLFGLGLKEMLADEITADLRESRQRALIRAKASEQNVTLELLSKGIHYGSITATPAGSFDTTKVQGVNPDLRVRPFFLQGGTMSIREFVIGALNAEMGMQGWDGEMVEICTNGGRLTTTAGMVLDSWIDQIEVPPSLDAYAVAVGTPGRNQVAVALVDYLEFYLLNYFKPGIHEQNMRTTNGRRLLENIGCTSCHLPDLQITRDRRVADVETVYDPEKGGMNRLFATAVPKFVEVKDAGGQPSIKKPAGGPFLVKNIFSDFKRHDLGANFHERNYDGSMQKEMMTMPLWGVGTSAPYGHDGRSVGLAEVILRHGGEAQSQRDRFASLTAEQRGDIVEFLNSLVLFPPDDTASNLDPGDRSVPGYPQNGHGSIKLAVLFNDPKEPE
ncbi:MAG: di-heme oxidoredictase family protein [Bryobacteraceae bacterium]